MTHVVIAHGYEGSAESHWFPWLKKELESQGHTVWCETLPFSSQPREVAWTKVLTQEALVEDSIFIGHSLGVAAGLLALKAVPTRLKAFYALAGFRQTPPVPFAEDLAEFRLGPLDDETNLWSECCPHWHIWASKDDPYVPLNLSAQIYHELEAVIPRPPGSVDWKVFSGRDHLGTWPGAAGQFPELLESLQRYL